MLEKDFERAPDLPEKAQEPDKPNSVTPPPSVSQPGREVPATGRTLFKSLTRELSDADMGNSGVQKMLLAELERLENENANSRGYIERFHDADKDRAVLQEKVRTVKSIDIICGTGIAIGGIMVGLSPAFWSSPGILFLIIGAILIISATLARIVKK